MGMADGFAQASGRPTHVNLHTAPGVGNAVGGIFNAQANKSPLVITAGQQVRPHITIEANLTNRDAMVGPQPYVKWSHEPPRAQEVPGALARAIHLASLPPRGPVFVSIPMDDWGAEADEDRTVNAIGRAVSGRAGADPAALARARRQAPVGRQPGPDRRSRHRRQRRLGRRDRAGRAPAPAGLGVAGDRRQPDRLPREPPAVPRRAAAGDRRRCRETLADHDLLLVVGSSVFPYYPYIPGPLLPEGASLVAITSDPGEAARAPMGEAIVGDVAGALAALVELVGESDRQAPRAASGLARPAGRATR